MQLLYNSDSFVVLQVDMPASDASDDSPRAGFEIVDKQLRKGLFIEGVLAREFRAGVQALIDAGPSEDALDDYIATYTTLSTQPLTVH